MDSEIDLEKELTQHKDKDLAPAELKLLAQKYSLSELFNGFKEFNIQTSKNDLDLVIVSCKDLGQIESYLPEMIEMEGYDCKRVDYILGKLKAEKRSPQIVLKDIKKIVNFKECKESILLAIAKNFSYDWADDIFTVAYELDLLNIKLAQEVISHSAPYHYDALLKIISEDEGNLKEYKNQLLVHFFNFDNEINETEYQKNTDKYQGVTLLFMELSSEILNDVRRGVALIEKLVKSGLNLTYLIKNLQKLPLFKGLYLDVIIKNHLIVTTTDKLVKSLAVNDIYLGDFPAEGSLANQIYDSLKTDEEKVALSKYYLEEGISKKGGLFS